MHDNKPGDVIKELARCYAVVLRAGVNNPIHEPEQQLIDRALKLADAVDKMQEALIKVSNRTDGDGKPCWCHNEMTDGMFAPSHAGWCRNARGILFAIEEICRE